MKNYRVIIIILVLIFASILIWHYDTTIRQEIEDLSHTRLIYYEGGPYYDYVSTLVALFKGLNEIGVIEEIEIPNFYMEENSKIVWDYLCDNVKSEYIQLSKDDYYSSSWGEKEREANKKSFLERLDLIEENCIIIAMGTWAGLDLIDHPQKKPVMVLSTTDPISSGIIDSKNDYSNHNAFVEYLPGIYYQQINVFYSIFEFKNLGILYSNTDDGKAYTAYNDIYKSAKEKGFIVTECIFNDYLPDMIQKMKSGKKCIDELSAKVDAIYLGDHTFLKYEYISYLLESTLENKIPVWAHHGSEHVKRGALMSKSYRATFRKKGVWEAHALKSIILGTQPSKIPRTWRGGTELVINLEVAKRIGFEVPEMLLKISDQIFTHIERSNVDTQELLK